MQNYGVINQYGFYVIYDQKLHRQVFKSTNFVDIYNYMNEHPGEYNFKDFTTIMYSE